MGPKKKITSIKLLSQSHSTLSRNKTGFKKFKDFLDAYYEGNEFDVSPSSNGDFITIEMVENFAGYLTMQKKSNDEYIAVGKHFLNNIMVSCLICLRLATAKNNFVAFKSWLTDLNLSGSHWTHNERKLQRIQKDMEKHMTRRCNEMGKTVSQPHTPFSTDLNSSHF
jgi:hypothetical protein